MKENRHRLAGLDAAQLSLWKVGDFFNIVYFSALLTPHKVSIKITRDLKNDVQKYQLVDDVLLLESDILSDAFPNPVQGYLHVVMQTPSVGEYSDNE